MNNLMIVILAAGKGTRMKSDLPKVCHKVGDKTMVEHVVNTSSKLNPSETVIVVSKENFLPIKDILTSYDVRFKIQYQQLGTAHAVLTALECDDTSDVLVLLGDTPLITTDTLSKIVSTGFDAVIMGFVDRNPNSKWGRIVVENSRVKRIVEYNEASDKERQISLCNSGMLWIKSTHVPLLYQIDNNNSKEEYYLTDIVKIMVERNLNIGFMKASYEECMGVNTQEDLALVNRIYNSN